MKIILFLISFIAPLSSIAQQNIRDLFIGTYTNTGKSEGVYVYTFNDETGDFSFKSKATGIIDPSFLAFNPKGNNLYAVNKSAQGKGAVTAFSYNPSTGALKIQNELLTKGVGPCYITLDKDNKFAFVANYSDGSLSVLSLAADGSLKEVVQYIQFKGQGPHKSRQKGPHAHSAVLSPDEKFLAVQDLGTDIITIYPFVSGNAKNPLQISEAISVQTPPGGGPRHITFSKDGRFIYVVAELTSTVQVYTFTKGKMQLIQELSMLSKEIGNQVGAADIHLSHDGKFLYASNRGNANEINIYKVDASSGKIKAGGGQSSMGIWPRNFVISKNDKFLLAANQKSDEVVIFKRNQKTGELSDTGKRISVGAPVCLIFN